MRTHDHGFETGKGKKLSRKKNKNIKALRKHIDEMSNEHIARLMEESVNHFSQPHIDETGRAIFRSMQNQLGGSQFQIQAKLEISHPEDHSERQADDLAQSVMHGSPEQSQDILSNPTNEVSRMSEGDEGGMQTSGEFDQQLQSTKGQGQKLDDETKSELEEHTGADLSGVNIHTSGQAHNMSESINAKAFTHGQDIYFKQGNYNPNSKEGKELLAHEVAHTVQQGEGIATKIQRTDDRPGKTTTTFTIDISKYVPALINNAKKSASYAWSQIFQISPEDAEKFIPYGIVNSDGSTFYGYEDSDVKRGSATVNMPTSIYFVILDKIKGVPKSKESITNMAGEIQEALKTANEDDVSWTTLNDELRVINKELSNYSAADITSLQTEYQTTYGNSLSWDVNIIESKLNNNSSDKTDAIHINGLLLIGAIKALVSNMTYEPQIPDNPEVKDQDKVHGKIMATAGDAVVMVGFTSGYKIYLENKQGITYQYDWYVLYDTRYASDKQAHIAHESGTNEFTYEWDGSGMHKVICKVTQVLGETPVQVDYYATQQYVYPSSVEFADRQAETDLQAIESSNIFTDTYIYESQSVGNRIKYINEFMSMQATDFVPKYIDADLATTVISDKVRELTTHYMSNPFYQGEEMRKYEKKMKEMEKESPDNPQLETDLANLETNIPGLGSSVTSGTFDGATFKTKIIDFYNTLTEWGYKNDMDYTWWSKYVQYSHPFWKVSDVKALPDTIDENNVSSWAAVLKGYREVLASLDKFLEFSLKLAKREDEANQFAYMSKMGLNTADVYENHPDAITIPAIFYPDEQALTLDKETATQPLPANYSAPGYRVFFYLYRSVEDNGFTHKWVLREAGSGYQNEIPAGDGEGVLNDETKIQDLFQKLDSKIRFPKGILKYKFPITNTSTQEITYKSKELITTEAMPLSEWLKDIGIAIGLLAVTVATLGAATPVVATLAVLSTGLMIAGNIQSMKELDQQGALTKGEIALNLTYIITDLLAGLASGSKLLSLAAKPSSSLAVFAGKSFITLERYSLAAGKVSLLVAGADIFNQLTVISEIKDEKERNAAYTRILGHLIIVGLVHIVSNNYNWKYEAQWQMRNPNTTGIIGVQEYRYSQATASSDLADGTTSLSDLTNDLKVRGWDFTKPPPRIVDIGDGTLITLDHRRLVAARNAGLTEHPYQLIKGETPFPSDLKSLNEYSIRSKLNKATYEEVETLIGRKINKSDPLSRQPQTYKEAVIFRAANQRTISGFKDFPLTGSPNVPQIK